MYCAHRPAGSVSLFFILSFLLVLFLWKSMVDYLFRNMLRSHLSQSNFWQFFFFTFFLKRAESHFVGLKVFRCYSFFYTSSFWFPEVLPTCAMRGRWFFPLFLAGLFDAWEGRGFSSIPCASSFFCLFLLNCLNILLTMLTRLGGSRAFWQSLRIPAQLSSSILWHGLFPFLSSFLISFWASPFFFLMLFGLQTSWAYHFFSFFVAPLLLFL